MPIALLRPRPALLLVAATAVIGTALVSTPAVAGPQSTTFTTGTHEWTVPSGVSSVTVRAVGGAGGQAKWVSHPDAPGRGDDLTATLAVVPGDVLHLHVAGHGADASENAETTGRGGANGGGRGGDAGDGFGGGGGGGATDVRIGGDELDDRVLVAAGGGGSGFNAGSDPVGSAGGNAGEPGSVSCNGTGAGAGTSTAGGAAGQAATCSSRVGTDGTLGQGGDGAASPGTATGGGGGGGGLYGGAGGNTYGGGGGGSSYVAPDATDVIRATASADADPSLILSWKTPKATDAVGTADDAALPADGTSTTTVRLRLLDDDDQPVAGDPVVFSASTGTIGETVDHGDGTYSATYTAGTVSGTATIGVSNEYSPAVEGQLLDITLDPAAPLAPSDVTATSGDRSATVSWTPPPATEHPVTSYTVTRNGGTTRVVKSSATSVRFTGLKNGKTYTFTVVARNAVGTSPVSTASAPVVPAARPGTVSKPNAKAGKRKAIVAWKAPSSNGSTITTYRVRSSTGKTVTVSGTKRRMTFTALAKGKKVSFKVRAINDAGRGSYSRSSATVKIK